MFEVSRRKRMLETKRKEVSWLWGSGDCVWERCEVKRGKFKGRKVLMERDDTFWECWAQRVFHDYDDLGTKNERMREKLQLCLLPSSAATTNISGLLSPSPSSSIACSLAFMSFICNFFLSLSLSQLTVFFLCLALPYTFCFLGFLFPFFFFPLFIIPCFLYFV